MKVIKTKIATDIRKTKTANETVSPDKFHSSFCTSSFHRNIMDKYNILMQPNKRFSNLIYFNFLHTGSEVVNIKLLKVNNNFFRPHFDLIFYLVIREKMNTLDVIIHNKIIPEYLQMPKYLQELTKSNFNISTLQLRSQYIIPIMSHFRNVYKNSLWKLVTENFKFETNFQICPDNAYLPILTKLNNHLWIPSKNIFANKESLIAGKFEKTLYKKSVAFSSKDKPTLKFFMPEYLPMSKYLMNQTESDFSITDQQFRIQDLITQRFHLRNEYEQRFWKLVTQNFIFETASQMYTYRASLPIKANLAILSDIINYSWIKSKNISKQSVAVSYEDMLLVKHSIIFDIFRSFQNLSFTSLIVDRLQSKIKRIIKDSNKDGNKDGNNLQFYNSETEIENNSIGWKIEKQPLTDLKFLYNKRRVLFSYLNPLSPTFEKFLISGSDLENVPDDWKSIESASNFGLLGRKRKHGILSKNVLNPKYFPLKNTNLEYAGFRSEDTVTGQIKVRDKDYVFIGKRPDLILKRPVEYVSMETSMSTEKSLSDSIPRETSPLLHEISRSSIVSPAEINNIADRVYKLLTTKLIIEKERRGLR